jgi:hypothetical protein
MLRLAPLFYGGLGCLGLFAGGRRWLGRWGGGWAVVLFCSSAAAVGFAWRATMPTFTDASLIAAGTGALLWTMLACGASPRRRTVAGLLGFLALEGATSIRYTDVVILLVAVVVVIAARRAARLSLRMLAAWFASLAIFIALIATFSALFYGGVTKTGYGAGEITFGLGAVLPNLEHLPARLVSSMPLLVPAAIAVIWMAVLAACSFRTGLAQSVRSTYRRDAAVGVALLAGWVGIYALYLAYTWTVPQAAYGAATIHVVRFYVPALAAVALLAAWLLKHLPRWLPPVALAVLVCLAGVTYPGLVNGGFGGPGGPGRLLGPPPGGQLPNGPPPNGQLPNGPRPNGSGLSGSPPPGGSPGG